MTLTEHMKLTIEKVSNGFVIEYEVYSYRPSETRAYTMIAESVGVRRVIAPSLEDVFSELHKVFPAKTSEEPT